MDEDIKPIPTTAIGDRVGIFFWGLAGIERAGLILCHHDRHKNFCTTPLAFDLPEIMAAFPERRYHHLISVDPLSISPSILCRACGLHGYIRDSKWVPIYEADG